MLGYKETPTVLLIYTVGSLIIKLFYSVSIGALKAHNDGSVVQPNARKNVWVSKDSKYHHCSSLN